jgi:AmmeMemoRadiSam system protein A
MAHSPSPDTPPLESGEHRLLLALARESIAHGLAHGRALAVDPTDYAPQLQAQRAAFVTLHEHGQLRGCIGHLEAVQPLVRDVVENAFAAAFRDPRFPPVTAGELEALHIEISVLTIPQPMQFASEADLLAQIEPGRDGLILEEGRARGTFLPSVWASLPQPEAFLRHLKLKAGLPQDYWSPRVRISRYRTESFAE